MKYRINQDKSWTLKDLKPESVEEAREGYRKRACWRPDLKEKPTSRLPFPVLRSYWLKLAEEQEDKRVKGKEMYYTIKVYDDESVLEHISLDDKEPIEGIILRTLTWKLPKNQVLDKRSLRLIARSNTRRLTSEELKIAYPKLYKREIEYQKTDKTYLYSVQEMRRCFIDIPNIGYQRANKEINKNLIHFTKRAAPNFTIILGDSDY